MAIRLSGINSGLDTDALVKELVSAYSLKTEKYEKQKTKLEWKQEAWQSLNTKIYGLYTKVSNLQYDSSYNLKKTMVSDSTKASVTASGSAASGTQKLSIISTAQACYITGSRLDDEITGSTKLKDLGVSGNTSLTIDRYDGTDETIDISEDDTVSGLMQKLRGKGLNANFDENNNRVYISAKESGSKANFTLESSDVNVKTLLSELGLNSSDQEIACLKAQAEVYNADSERWASYVANYENDDAAVAAYQSAIDAYDKAQARYLASDALKQIVDASVDKEVETENLLEFVNKKDATTDEIKEYLSEKGFTDEELKNIDAHIKTIAGYSSEENGEITEESITPTSLEQMATELTGETGTLKQSYDEAIEISKIKARMDAYKQDTNIMAVVADSNRAEEIVNAMKNNAQNPREFATTIRGTDAEIILNDVHYTSTSNSFSINGLTIEAYAETTDEITITTSTDTQGIYDKIKDFLTEYNTVINEITKLYNADSAKDYEPLTDDEKDAMSETEIEKWENKIKSALLRRDSSLGSVMNAMINSMAQTFEVDGQKLSLGNFGISTLGYLNAAENEQYAYHIDGDEDDASTSGKTDKLMAAIQTNPDQIVEFMKQLTTSLYKSIDEKMKSTELSSVYKVYNDKEMDDDLRDIEDLIEKWEDKVAEQEDYYYGKFSDMEVALSKLQSQTSALSGLLGS